MKVAINYLVFISLIYFPYTESTLPFSAETDCFIITLTSNLILKSEIQPQAQASYMDLIALNFDFKWTVATNTWLVSTLPDYQFSKEFLNDIKSKLDHSQKYFRFYSRHRCNCLAVLVYSYFQSAKEVVSKYSRQWLWQFRPDSLFCSRQKPFPSKNSFDPGNSYRNSKFRSTKNKSSISILFHYSPGKS